MFVSSCNLFKAVFQKTHFRIIGVELIRHLTTSRMAGVTSEDRLVWLDMEMTGLDVSKDTILECACVITTPDLKCVHEGVEMIIHQPDTVLNSMNQWSLKHHEKTGLTKASRESSLSLEDAEKQLHKYVKTYTSSGTNYLAGNTVYMDRRFLERYMPPVDNLLHYRIIDVSTVKELCRLWYPNKYENIPRKKLAHRALSDIHESIDELKAYRSSIFI